MTTATAVEKPKRIQRKRTKGWRMPDCVYVGRPSFWGNPYLLSDYGPLALDLYRNTVQGIWNPTVLDGLPDSLRQAAYQAHVEWRARARHILRPEIQVLLGGKNLACWCKEPEPDRPDLCHAAILLELANQ